MSRMEGQTPRCGNCGKLMEVYDKANNTVTYECCGRSINRPAKEYSYTPQKV